MTATAALPLRRRGPRRAAVARRRVAALLAVAAALAGASCRVGGAAVIAPYRSPPVAQVTARAVPGTTGVLALSPDGTLEAVVDPVRGVCFRAVGPAVPAAPTCTDLRPGRSAAISAEFSADGRWVAVGQDVSAQRAGLVWLVDPRTGSARPVPAAGGRPAVARSTPGSSTSGTSTGATTAAQPPDEGVAPYTGMVWGAAGDLLLISTAQESDGPYTRLVDVDPVSLVPRVVAQATGPYEFESGYLATGGSAVLLTVYRSDQLVPNLVDIDLVSGVRREVGPIGAAGTQLVPLAVSPDGRTAVVGSATLDHPGPPRLLDVASGTLVDIPHLTGDFGVAAFSPDGARVAVASTESDGRVSLALAAVGAAPLAPARLLGTVPGPLPAGGRLSWSRFDVLSLTGRPAAGATPVTGWLLTG